MWAVRAQEGSGGGGGFEGWVVWVMREKDKRVGREGDGRCGCYRRGVGEGY